MASSLLLYAPQPPTQCVPTTFSWVGGEAPYTLNIVMVDENGDLIPDAPQQSYTTSDKALTWAVNVSGGMRLTLLLTDSSTTFGDSGVVEFQGLEVLNGSDSSCLSTSVLDSSTVTPTASLTSSSLLATTTLTSSPSLGMVTAPSMSSLISGHVTQGPSNTVAGSSGTTPRSSVWVVLAVAGAVGLLLLAALAYYLWKTRRTLRAKQPLTIDLLESSIISVEPPVCREAEDTQQAPDVLACSIQITVSPPSIPVSPSPTPSPSLARIEHHVSINPPPYSASIDVSTPKPTPCSQHPAPSNLSTGKTFKSGALSTGVSVQEPQRDLEAKSTGALQTTVLEVPEILEDRFARSSVPPPYSLHDHGDVHDV